MPGPSSRCTAIAAPMICSVRAVRVDLVVMRHRGACKIDGSETVSEFGRKTSCRTFGCKRIASTCTLRALRSLRLLSSLFIAERSGRPCGRGRPASSRRAPRSSRRRISRSTASARTIATIASPTTAAAGTAQTSLRSMAAGLSVIVVEIDRAQRLHQRRDRLHVAGDAQILAVGDAAFEAAGVVGRPGDADAARRRRRSRGRISSWTREPGHGGDRAGRGRCRRP